VRKRTATPVEGLSGVQYTRISVEQAGMLEQLRTLKSAENPGMCISRADVVRGLIEDAARRLRGVPSAPPQRGRVG
jgi:hypothetical protein